MRKGMIRGDVLIATGAILLTVVCLAPQLQAQPPNSKAKQAKPSIELGFTASKSSIEGGLEASLSR